MIFLPNRLLCLMTTAVLAATSGVAADDFIGFDHSCVSWYVAPVGTQSLLIARCYNAQYATSKSDEDIICSQLDLNQYDGYDQLTPKSTPDDTTWYPNNCSQANIEGDSPTDSTTVLATFCNLVAPGFGGIIPTSVDLGPTIANWNGYLGCLDTTGVASTMCR